jgi:hypothetical protein
MDYWQYQQLNSMKKEMKQGEKSLKVTVLSPMEINKLLNKS